MNIMKRNIKIIIKFYYRIKHILKQMRCKHKNLGHEIHHCRDCGNIIWGN